MIKYLLDNHNKVFYKCNMEDEVEKEFFEQYMSDPYTSQIYGDEEFNRKRTFFDMTEYISDRRKSEALSKWLEFMGEEDEQDGVVLAEYFYYSDRAHFEELSLGLRITNSIEERINDIPEKERRDIEHNLKQSDLDF